MASIKNLRINGTTYEVGGGVSSYNDLTDKPSFKTINGETIIGTGDITIETEIPIQEIDNESTCEIVLNKNTYYKLSNMVECITINLNELNDTISNKYYIEFYGNNPTVIFGNDVQFDKGIIPNFNYIPDNTEMDSVYILEFDNDKCKVSYFEQKSIPWIKLTYNVTSTTEPTQLLYNSVTNDVTFKIND